MNKRNPFAGSLSHLAAGVVLLLSLLSNGGGCTRELEYTERLSDGTEKRLVYRSPNDVKASNLAITKKPDEFSLQAEQLDSANQGWRVAEKLAEKVPAVRP